MRQQLGFLDRDKTLHNVFFAVLPDAATATCAKTIACNVHRRFGLTATPISSERLHVSLLAVGGFSGSCPPSVIDAAMTAADTVSMASFRVAFDRVASFSGSHGKRALVLTGNGDCRETFAAGLLLPLTNVGRGVAPPFESMSPAEIARWCMLFLCASKYAIDRDI